MLAREMRHPLSGHIYGIDDDGLVRVEKTDSDEYGRFHADGRWADGPVRHADPQLCLWIGGPMLPEGETSLMALLARAGGEAPTEPIDGGRVSPHDLTTEGCSNGTA